MARVLAIEPYGSDSHRCWIEGYLNTSVHDIRSVTLPAERWRWRLRMGASEIAEEVVSICVDGWRPDAVLISGMVNVAALIGIARKTLATARVTNHRWDHDKDPGAFFRSLARVDDLPWRLAVVGANERLDPREFDDARTRFADRIEVFGHLARDEYVSLLCRSDIVVSTALHENFGVAVLEAIAAGAVPLLPNRLSYPDLIPRRWAAAVLYGDGALDVRLREVVCDLGAAVESIDGLSTAVRDRYSTAVVTPLLDSVVADHPAYACSTLSPRSAPK